MRLISALFVGLCLHAFVKAEPIGKTCDKAEDCLENQECHFGRCECKGAGTFLWHGIECLKRRSHGEPCRDQSECSSSGDPYLACVMLDGIDEKRCLCPEKFDLIIQLDSSKRCTRQNFTLNKMDDPLDDEDDVIEMHEDFDKKYRGINSIHDVYLNRHSRVDHLSMNAAWAPLIITLMALIVIMLCCCFLRINPSSPHSYEVDIERRMKEAQMVDEEAGFDEIELGEANVASTPSGGFDNVAYTVDDDAVSRYTTSTVEAEDHEDENGNNKKKNNTRSKIRTNPHLIKESTLEKKANKRRAQNHRTDHEQSNAESDLEESADNEEEEEPKCEECVENEGIEYPDDKNPFAGLASANSNEDNDNSEYGTESLEIQGIQGIKTINDDKHDSLESDATLSADPVAEAESSRPKLERVDTDETTSIDTTTQADEVVINPRKMMSQISTLSSSACPDPGEQRFIA